MSQNRLQQVIEEESHPMPSNTKTLVLVDGSSYIYRAFHALPALVNSRGFPTGAIYGFINMLKKLLQDYKPDYVAVIFDTPGKTFRDEIYADYKATRSEMPDDLSRQVQLIHDLVKALGIPIIAIPGVEADDVIGTLVEEAKFADLKIIVSTGDKDLAQLVNNKVFLINTMTNVVLDPPGVLNKFGVPPEAIVDYLTLIGDSIDNIPGVPLVGPKTAAKWLQKYGNLQELVANAKDIPGKAGENFRQFIEQIPLTKELVTLKRDIALSVKHTDLVAKAKDTQTLLQLYQELEFKTWLSELLTENTESKPTRKTHYKTITQEKDFNAWLAKLLQTDTIAIDFTIAVNEHKERQLIGIALAIETQTKQQTIEAVYIPFSHDYSLAPTQLTKNWVLEELKPIFENPNIQKISHHFKQVLKALLQEKISLNGKLIDIMLESYLLDSASNAHDLNSLTLKYLGWRIASIDEIVGKGSKAISFSQIDLATATNYAAEKTDVMLRLQTHLKERILANKKLNGIFAEIEMPLVNVLSRMEFDGVFIDPKKLIAQGKALQTRLTDLEQEAFRLASTPFNVNSPKQLQEILFQQLKLPILQKTPKGQPSTADSVLQELALAYELPRIIIEIRSISKLISTYTNRLVTDINPQTQRVHTSYNQTGTSTGRLSSSDPNLQNIPIRTVEGRRIRKAFVAPKGYQLVSADYSQIELRLMAHLSQDQGLLSAFQQNLDIHRATAAEVWEMPIDKVTNEMRRNAKAINFGLIYGMSAFGLTRQLGIDRAAAQDYIDRYFNRYPAVKTYMEKTRMMAKKQGYVETLFGRRLAIPDINSTQIPRQKAAERAAINAPLQGSAADIIKLAMIQIDAWLQEQHIDAKMIMQVHDELVFEVANSFIDDFIPAIRHAMTSVIELDVPLIVDVGIGNNWDDASAH